MSDPTPIDDSVIVTRLSILLRLGVIASAFVVALGGIVYLLRHGGEVVPNRQTFEPERVEYSRPAAIVEAARGGSGRAMIQVGLVILIATPIFRVAYSALAFGRRKDWLYTLIPVIVLAVILVGLIFAPAGK